MSLEPLPRTSACRRAGGYRGLDSNQRPLGYEGVLARHQLQHSPTNAQTHVGILRGCPWDKFSPVGCRFPGSSGEEPELLDLEYFDDWHGHPAQVVSPFVWKMQSAASGDHFIQ